MILEDMNDSLASPNHGANENVPDIDVISILLCGFTLKDALRSQGRVYQFPTDFELPIFL
jgi:hypothetical protein